MIKTKGMLVESQDVFDYLLSHQSFCYLDHKQENTDCSCCDFASGLIFFSC